MRVKCSSSSCFASVAAIVKTKRSYRGRHVICYQLDASISCLAIAGRFPRVTAKIISHLESKPAYTCCHWFHSKKNFIELEFQKKKVIISILSRVCVWISPVTPTYANKEHGRLLLAKNIRPTAFTNFARERNGEPNKVKTSNFSDTESLRYLSFTV